MEVVAFRSSDEFIVIRALFKWQTQNKYALMSSGGSDTVQSSAHSDTGAVRV
jgi:hypothetical protein